MGVGGLGWVSKGMYEIRNQGNYEKKCFFLKCLFRIYLGDVDDIFLPSPSDLLVNLQACKQQVQHE